MFSLNIKFEMPSFGTWPDGPHTLTRSSAAAEGSHNTPCQLKSTAAQLYEKSHLKDVQQMNDLDDRSRSSDLPPFDKPYVTSTFCNNNVCILHRFRDTATFTVYVTYTQ